MTSPNRYSKEPFPITPDHSPARPYGNPYDVDIIVEKSGKQPGEFLTPAGLAVYETMKAAETSETDDQKEE